MLKNTNNTKIVSVDSIWEYGKVKFDQVNENHLLIKLQASKMDSDKQRSPIAVEAVVDCSGSMGGEKIDFVRKTLKVLVDHMSERDYLGITAFSTSVWEISPLVKCDKDGKDKIKSLISNIQPSNTTNISGGILKGAQVISAAELSSDYIQRVILLTDGLPNVGVSDYTGLIKISKDHYGSETTCSMSAFGYGSDHDPELLAGMAKNGRGNFHYIESPDKVPSCLGLEIGGLLSCVAQNLEIKLSLNDNVEVLDVLNDYDVDTNGNITSVSIDDIYAEENKSIVVKFKLPEMSKAVAARPTKKVLDLKLSYTNILTGNIESIDKTVELDYVKSSDVSDVNPEVEKQIALLTASSLHEKAIKEADSGKFDDAQVLIKLGMEKLQKCQMFNTDPLLQSLHVDLKNIVPNYTKQLYSGDIRAFSTSNTQSMFKGRARGGGGTASCLYNTTATYEMAGDFENSFADLNDSSKNFVDNMSHFGSTVLIDGDLNPNKSFKKIRSKSSR